MSVPLVPPRGTRDTTLVGHPRQNISGRKVDLFLMGEGGREIFFVRSLPLPVVRREKRRLSDEALEPFLSSHHRAAVRTDTLVWDVIMVTPPTLQYLPPYTTVDGWRGWVAWMDGADGWRGWMACRA